ncbi:solute carrier family 41 member 1-like [Saccoglossus kowalevskii]|uniref:Solute carrier family 41 member 1-like n=1 Tax=Saccoglossus kowalevskii TaxID=10224 RepID=A0ABM0GZ24_SACKO|nr:PREDICTED: solute carrier family 41 member 1-like [Saccoglossus kowalevskii]
MSSTFSADGSCTLRQRTSSREKSDDEGDDTVAIKTMTLPTNDPVDVENQNTLGSHKTVPKNGHQKENGSIPDANDTDDAFLQEETLSTPLLGTSAVNDVGDEVTHRLPGKTGTESVWSISLQVFFPFLIAGFGTVGAGIVLDIVQHWTVFIKVSEVFILVPALLGLKGNLEMTLASRLSTAANIGLLDTRKEQWLIIGGNIVLTQCQAIVVGFLASVAAVVMGWIPDGIFNLHHGFILCASSLVTASAASFILGTVMVSVILLSKKCHINPDNVATPIAASLGDLTTLALLSWISRYLYEAIEVHNQFWIAPTIIVVFVVFLAPLWAFISHKNRYTHDVLYSGWTPVISAMVISSVGGLVLDFAVSNYHGVAVFTPIINGVGGNLVAVQASRISTDLHSSGKPGDSLPDDAPKGCRSPCKTFFGGGPHSKTARVLLCMVVPGHLIFLYTISYLQAGHTTITVIFTLAYSLAAVLQVILLLIIADWMIHLMWRKYMDPDNAAIPYLTAIGDLLGTGFLALTFHILWLIGDRDSDVGD